MKVIKESYNIGTLESQVQALIYELEEQGLIQDRYTKRLVRSITDILNANDPMKKNESLKEDIDNLERVKDKKTVQNVVMADAEQFSKDKNDKETKSLTDPMELKKSKAFLGASKQPVPKNAEVPDELKESFEGISDAKSELLNLLETGALDPEELAYKLIDFMTEEDAEEIFDIIVSYLDEDEPYLEGLDSRSFFKSTPLTEGLSRYTFTDGMELVATSPDEAMSKYADIESNRSRRNRPLKEIDSIAHDLYDKEDDFSFHYFSDDELVNLWVLCCTDGREYDDEVFEAISDFPNKEKIFSKASKIVKDGKEGKDTTNESLSNSPMSYEDAKEFCEKRGLKLTRKTYKMILKLAGASKKDIKEGWYHFEYKSGGNPYIAKSEKERDRLLRKYKGKVTQLQDKMYEIDDTDENPFSGWHTSDYSK